MMHLTFKEPGKFDGSDGNVHSCVYRQNHVRKPVDKIQKRVPIRSGLFQPA